MEETKLDFDWNEYVQRMKEQKENAVNFPVLQYHNSFYQIDITTRLIILEKEMSRSQTRSIWKLDSLAENTIQAEAVKKELKKIDSQMKPLMEMVEKMNKAADILQFELDKNNSIKQIINTKQVLKNWEKIKFEELKMYELEGEALNAIITAYDKELHNLSRNIGKNLLYQLFFYPSGAVRYPNSQPELLAEKKQMVSQIFGEQEIYYNLFCKSFEEEDRILVRCGGFKPDAWVPVKLKELYNKNFSELVNLPFSYDFKIEGRYYYTKEFQLERAKIYYKEQASEGLLYLSEYEFTLLPEAEYKEEKI